MTTGKIETTHNLSRALVSQGKDDVQKIEISLDVCATDITQIVFQTPLLKVKKYFSINAKRVYLDLLEYSANRPDTKEFHLNCYYAQNPKSRSLQKGHSFLKAKKRTKLSRHLDS